MDSDDYYNIDIRKVINFLKEETIFKKNYTFNKQTKKEFMQLSLPTFGGTQ